jgi:hypothetical protein
LPKVAKGCQMVTKWQQLPKVAIPSPLKGGWQPFGNYQNWQLLACRPGWQLRPHLETQK